MPIIPNKIYGKVQSAGLDGSVLLLLFCFVCIFGSFKL